MVEYRLMPSTAKNAPRSHALAGWLANINRDQHSPFTTEGVATGFNTCLDLHHATAKAYACAATTPVYVDEKSSLTGLIIGTPQWTTDTLRALACEHGHAAALCAAYQEYGDQLTDCLRGPFALAVLDPASATALLAIDRMGRFPMYYRGSEDGLLFGTSAQNVLAMWPEPAALNQQGLYDYVYFHMVPAPAPVFAGLKKLQAGCMVKFHAGAINGQRYWQPVFREKATDRRPAAYAALKSQLKASVAACLPPSGKVGAFLSGGLDSSTVTGMLAELSNRPCDVYSIGFAAEGYDEMAYARITARHFGANLHEYYVTPEDVVEALPLIASAYDEPFGNSSALPAYFCAKLAAEDGVSLLLAGDGGDELFAGNERYAKQKTFEAYQHLPTFLAKRLLEPLVRAAPAWLPLADKARSYIAQANTPLPDRLQTYNFLHHYQASEVFQESFLEHVDNDYPVVLQRNIYHTPQSASSLNRMLFLDWQLTLADNDLLKVTRTSSVAGIDVAYPMLNDDLVDFSLGIPSDWKLPGNKLRDFYKRALVGWLPDATLNKSKQGFGLPFGVWMRTHRPLQDIAYDNITKLKSREIFQGAFLDNAIAMHREGHAAYFGELIWILTVLELWLSNRPV